MYDQDIMDSAEGVSIIVCCYNSVDRLPRTIEHLSKQQVPDNIPWEVIVVDNASIDDTSQVAQELWEEYGHPTSFRIIEEKKAGLSFARHAGFSNAKYEYCLFCDDDNWLSSKYVVEVYRILSDNTEIGVLGGKGEAVFESEQPKWFERYKGYYAVGPQSQMASGPSFKGHVYGAGMVIRKSAYYTLLAGGFESLLNDRKGNSLMSGGDTELCLALAIKGYSIQYDERLNFRHFISKNRVTLNYLIKLTSSIGASWLSLHPYLYARQKREYSSYIFFKDVGFLLFSVTKACLYFVKCLFSRDDLLEARMYVLATSKALVSVILGARKYDRKLRLLLA